MIIRADAEPVIAPVLRALVGVNNRLLRVALSDGHKDCVEYELAATRRSRSPTDDLTRKQIHNHRKAEPSLPRANVRDIGNPSPIWLGDIEIALQNVREELRRLRGCTMPGVVATYGADLVDAHEARHSMLAACLPRLTKIQEHAWGAVDGKRVAKAACAGVTDA